MNKVYCVSNILCGYFVLVFVISPYLNTFLFCTHDRPDRPHEGARTLDGMLMKRSAHELEFLLIMSIVLTQLVPSKAKHNTIQTKRENIPYI